jgi:hypothetical protein
VSVTHLDTATSDSPAHPTSPSGRARLGRWLWRLSEIAVVLVMRMSGIAAHRRVHGVASACVDLSLAWDLLSRAMGWTRALQARAAVEDEDAAAKAAMNPETRRAERLDDGADRNEALIVQRAESSEPVECIDDQPVFEVFEQICADLAAAATLLGDTEAAIHIAAIAAAACAMLADPAGTWTAEAVSDTPPAATAETG